MGEANYDCKKGKTLYNVKVKILEAGTKEELEKNIYDFCNKFEFYYHNKLDSIQYITPVKLKRNKMIYSAMIVYRYYY